MNSEGDWFSGAMNFAWLSFLAFIGIMARHAAATASTGKICVKCFLIDAITAPFLGLVAGALCTWWGVPTYATFATVAFVGYLGPAFVAATVIKVIDAWVANRSKGSS